MLSRNTSKQLGIFAALAMLMLLTRGNHFALTADLPSASTAIFLLAGFFLGGLVSFVALLGQAFGMDLWMVSQGHMDAAACFNQAYGFLLPAYGALWMGGRYLARHYEANGMMLIKAATVTVISASTAFLISKTSFYFLSGMYSTSWSGYMAKLSGSYAGYMAAPLMYVAMTSALYALIVVGFQQYRQHTA